MLYLKLIQTIVICDIFKLNDICGLKLRSFLPPIKLVALMSEFLVPEVLDMLTTTPSEVFNLNLMPLDAKLNI